MDRSIEQHNEHCKGWRWLQYVDDNKKRAYHALEEVDFYERYNLTSQQRADIELAHWQLLKVRA